MSHNRMIKRMIIFVAFVHFLAASPALFASSALAANQCDRGTKFAQWAELTQAPVGADDGLIASLEKYSTQIMAGVVAANYGGEIPDDKFCEAIDKSITQYTNAGCFVVCSAFWEACYTAQGTQPRAQKPSAEWQNCELNKKQCIARNCIQAN